MINVPPDIQLTPRARRAVEIANEEAVRRHHEYVGTAHLLIGLVASDDGTASTVVRNLGLPPRELRKRLEVVIRQGGQFPEGFARERAFTTKCRRVFAYAEEEARELGQSSVGTEHVLIGLLNEPASSAAQVLIEAGFTEDAVRHEALKLMGGTAVRSGVQPS